MKKLFLVVLAAGLFVACGNKTTDTENTDTTTVDSAAVVVEEEAPACEAVVEEPAVAENQAKPAAANAEDNKTIKETAKEVGTDVAKKAINKGGEEATKQINNVSTSDRGNR